MPESETFEEIVKKHVDAGADVHTAFGRAMQEDPEGYGQYLKGQTDTPDAGTDGNGKEGSLKP
jgi:hypothetical protein